MRWEASCIRPATVTLGDLVVRCPEQCGVGAAFGVILIHNMPIPDTPADPR